VMPACDPAVHPIVATISAPGGQHRVVGADARHDPTRSGESRPWISGSRQGSKGPATAWRDAEPGPPAMLPTQMQSPGDDALRSHVRRPRFCVPGGEVRSDCGRLTQVDDVKIADGGHHLLPDVELLPPDVAQRNPTLAKPT
jgi:hypothetical protein